MRFKAPEGGASRLMEWPVRTSEMKTELGGTSVDFRFSAAVAAFAQILRGGSHTGEFGYTDVLELARPARGADPFGYRGEFLSLVNLAGSLTR